MYSNARMEPPKLRYIVGIALLSSAVFAVSVQSLEKKAPKTEMSVQEYENNKTQARNRYKRIHFRPEQVQVTFVPEGCSKVPEGYLYLNVPDIIASSDPNVNKYHHIVERFREDGLPLPVTTTLAIVHDAMTRALADKPDGTKMIIGNFPKSIDEAVKFEQDIAAVDRLVTSDSKSPIAQYFDTVGKVSKKL